MGIAKVASLKGEAIGVARSELEAIRVIRAGAQGLFPRSPVRAAPMLPPTTLDFLQFSTAFVQLLCYLRRRGIDEWHVVKRDVGNCDPR